MTGTRAQANIGLLEEWEASCLASVETLLEIVQIIGGETNTGRWAAKHLDEVERSERQESQDVWYGRKSARVRKSKRKTDEE